MSEHDTLNPMNKGETSSRCPRGGKADELSMVESDGTVNYFETFKKE